MAEKGGGGGEEEGRESDNKGLDRVSADCICNSGSTPHCTVGDVAEEEEEDNNLSGLFWNRDSAGERPTETDGLTIMVFKKKKTSHAIRMVVVKTIYCFTWKRSYIFSRSIKRKSKTWMEQERVLQNVLIGYPRDMSTYPSGPSTTNPRTTS